MISWYVLMIFWVGCCGCFVTIFRNSYCCKRHRVNWVVSWVSYFLVLKSNVCDDWSFLFWRLVIFIFVFCLDFHSSVTIFSSWELTPFSFNWNPEDFAVFSHEFNSKWLICLRYFMVFESYGGEHRYSSGMPHLCKGCFMFSNFYLAATRPTLGHYREESLTQPMLITASLQFWPEGHRNPCCEIGSLGPKEQKVFLCVVLVIWFFLAILL